MGRTSRIQKYVLCFQKICNFWENYDFIEKQIVKKLIFFLAILKFVSLGCATKFHANEIYFFLSIFVRSKVIAFFVKNLPKLNILSVIAIDLVKIFKQTKDHLAHFMKV